MLMLLNPRLWLAVIVAVALAASHWKAYVMGKNTERVANLEATQAAIITARAEEKENAAKVQAAQSNQIKALAVKAADTERVTAERNSLRNEINSFAKGGDSQASSNQRAATLGELFASCTEEYASLGAKAQGHAVDVKALLEAWPK